jgi:anti-sigma-K factor RskA
MDPLSPNDPLHTLLGKARPVEPRSNFTQNVLRAVRQVPQTEGVWERIMGWLGGWGAPRMAFASVAAVAVVTALVVFSLQNSTPETLVVEAQPSTSTVLHQQPLLQPALHEVSKSMILAATSEITSAPAAVVEQADLDAMGVLYVQGDTSALSDTELALLVY